MSKRHYKKEFLKAVKERCFKKLKIYAAKIKDINLSLTVKGETALHLAVIQNDLSLIKFLLNLGADVNITTNRNETVLHLAVDNDNPSKEKAKRNLTFIRCNEAIVKYLLSQSVNVNCQDILGQSALHIAVMSSNESHVKLLLKAKINVNLLLKNYSTALHCAMKISTSNSNIMSIVELLVESGSQINIENKMGYTALYLAVSHNNINLAGYLISKGAHVNCKTKTPMFAAVKHCNLKMIKLLIKNGAEINVINDSGDFLLHYAMKTVPKGEKRLNLVKLLLRNGLNINAKNSDGCSVLFVALGIGDSELVHLLLKHGISVNTVNLNRQTPLHIAIKQDNQQWLEILLNHGAVANENSMQYPKDAEPLIGYAVHLKRQSLIEFLLDQGSDMHKSFKNFRTPLNYAICSGQHRIINLLLCRGVDINLTDQYGDTPLHHVVQKFLFRSDDASVRLLENLLSSGADVNKENSNGHTPLTMMVNSPWYEESQVEPGGTLIRHMTLMVVKSQSIGEANIRAIYERPELFCLFRQCLKELHLMKKIKLGKSNVCYYDLLTGERDQLVRYAQNCDIIEIIESERYKVLSSGYYHRQLMIKYYEGKKRLTLIQLARIKLVELAPIELPIEIASYICEYLTNRNLHNLKNTKPKGKIMPEPLKFSMILRNRKKMCLRS